MLHDPTMLIVTLSWEDEAALRAMAEYIRAQAWSGWRWLIRASQLPADFAGDPRIIAFDGNLNDVWPAVPHGTAELWLFLDRCPPMRTPRAFEQAWWFFQSHPRALYAAHVGEPGPNARLVARRKPGAGCYWMRGNGAPSRLPACCVPRGAKHLLMLLPWLEPGGADRCNLDIATCLVANGWTLTIVVTLEAVHRWAPRFHELTDDVFVLPHFLAAEMSSRFLIHLLDSRSPDLVLLSNCRFAYESLSLIHRHRPGLPVIDLNHMEEDWEEGGFPGLACRYDDMLGRHWVVSRHLQNWMGARGAPMSRTEVLHWFADSSFWRPDRDARCRLRQQLGIDMQTPVIAYAGRLCRQKRPDLFVHSLRELASKGERFAALVIGDGELEDELRRSLLREGLLPRVHLLGWLDDCGLRQAFQAADLFFLPSEAEGIALVLYEAMACGLAVVAADVGGQAELVGPECGRLIDPATSSLATAYADALKALLGNCETLRAMGGESRLRIRKCFDAKHFAERLLRLMDNAERAIAPSPEPPDEKSRARAALGLQWQWNSQRLVAALNRWEPTKPVANRYFVKRAIKAVFHMKAFGLAHTWARQRKPEIVVE